MLQIIYEDTEKIIVFKPSGKLTQGNRSFDVDLTSEVMTYRRKKKEEPYAAVINRLDRPVSGLVLFAKNKKEAARLSDLLQKKSFDKHYMAVICGKPAENSGTYVDYLVKNGADNITNVVSEEEASGNLQAKRAELKYQVVATFSDEEQNLYSLVKIELITGRHHQIRAQFASRNLPIAGDVKYGGPKTGSIRMHVSNVSLETNAGQQTLTLKRGEIALCSVSLTIDGTVYEAKPEWMIKDNKLS